MLLLMRQSSYYFLFSLIIVHLLLMMLRLPSYCLSFTSVLILLFVVCLLLLLLLLLKAVLQKRQVSRSLLHKYQSDYYNKIAFHYDATMQQVYMTFFLLTLLVDTSCCFRTITNYLYCYSNQQ